VRRPEPALFAAQNCLAHPGRRSYTIDVTNDNATSALERLLRPLSRSLTAELAHALVSVQADRETQARYDELADKRTQGQMTREEQAELEAMVRANTLLGVLKVEARIFLGQAPAP